MALARRVVGVMPFSNRKFRCRARGPPSNSRKPSQRRQLRDDAAKTFHQNVLVLNARLVPDCPCLDALARNVLGEAVRRDLAHPPLEHRPQLLGECMVVDGHPEREVPGTHPSIPRQRVQPGSADRLRPGRAFWPSARTRRATPPPSKVSEACAAYSCVAPAVPRNGIGVWASLARSPVSVFCLVFRDPLGYRRRRERAGGPAGSRGMAALNPRHLPHTDRRVLLQAVGRSHPEVRRQQARWQPMARVPEHRRSRPPGRVARGRRCTARRRSSREGHGSWTLGPGETSPTCTSSAS